MIFSLLPVKFTALEICDIAQAWIPGDRFVASEKLAEELNASGHFARRVIGAVYIQEDLYKEAINVSLPKFEGYRKMDHTWILTRTANEPGFWVLDVWLQDAVRCYDMHLIPHGCYREFNSSGERRYNHIRRLIG